MFIPVKRCKLLRNESNIWARLTFGRTDKDVRSSLTDVRARPYFRRILKQKQSPNADEIWFETKPTVGTRRGIDPAILRLSSDLKTLHMATILTLTTQGYRNSVRS